jgi:hypothetical protein
MPSNAKSKRVSSSVEKSFTVRCFVYPEKSTGMFVAECIDLDLMVKARRSNMAMRQLRDAILGYVKVAAESGLDSELIPRRAPISHRFHYYVVLVAAQLSLLSRERLFSYTPSTRTRCFA